MIRIVVLSFLVMGCAKRDAAPAGVSSAAVRLAPSQGKLTALLEAEVAVARARNLKPFLELRAEWCGPCKQLEASMGDPRMNDAFAGTYLISLDIDAWAQQLEGTAFDSSSIPVFYELDASAKPTGRKINGGAWAENIAANMAPPLKAFFADRQ